MKTLNIALESGDANSIADALGYSVRHDIDVRAAGLIHVRDGLKPAVLGLATERGAIVSLAEFAAQKAAIFTAIPQSARYRQYLKPLFKGLDVVLNSWKSGRLAESNVEDNEILNALASSEMLAAWTAKSLDNDLGKLVNEKFDAAVKLVQSDWLGSKLDVAELAEIDQIIQVAFMFEKEWDESESTLKSELGLLRQTALLAAFKGGSLPDAINDEVAKKIVARLLDQDPSKDHALTTALNNKIEGLTKNKVQISTALNQLLVEWRELGEMMDPALKVELELQINGAIQKVNFDLTMESTIHEESMGQLVICLREGEIGNQDFAKKLQSKAFESIYVHLWQKLSEKPSIIRDGRIAAIIAEVLSSFKQNDLPALQMQQVGQLVLQDYKQQLNQLADKVYLSGLEQRLASQDEKIAELSNTVELLVEQQLKKSSTEEEIDAAVVVEADSVPQCHTFASPASNTEVRHPEPTAPPVDVDQSELANVKP